MMVSNVCNQIYCMVVYNFCNHLKEVLITDAHLLIEDVGLLVVDTHLLNGYTHLLVADAFHLVIY